MTKNKKNTTGGIIQKKTKQLRLTVSFTKDKEEAQRCYEDAVRYILNKMDI